MGLVHKVHNDRTVASCKGLIYTLPEIEQILTSLISPVARVTFSTLQSLVLTKCLSNSDEKASLCSLRGICDYFNSKSKTGARCFSHLQPPEPTWRHLTLNGNKSSHFSSLTVSGIQSCETMLEVNQIPVMVLTSGRCQGLWLEGARQGQPDWLRVVIVEGDKGHGL